MTKRLAVPGVLFLSASVVLHAEALAQSGPLPVTVDQTAATVTAAGSAYRLGPEDEIVVHVVDVPDLTGKPQRVDPAGDIRLPMVGRIHAAGLTLEELEGQLTEQLKTYLQDPDVSITVTDFHSQPVSIIGAVGTAGVQQLKGRKTLIEVLSMAGGVSPDAGPTARITRRLEWGPIPLPDATKDDAGGFSTGEVDLRSLLDGKNPEQNIVIRPHDVISVPRAALVFVVGEVARPGPLPLNGGASISVLEAVSMSGGVLRMAAADRAWIVRRVGPQQRLAELNVDLKKITRGTLKDPLLVAGDILVVPDNTGKRVAARLVEVAIQTGTFFATYGVWH
jgi:polysaccharide export outer membrane protein